MKIESVFTLASRQREWLASRQAMIANNVSNVNTPGFKATDISAFDPERTGDGTSLTRTNGAHIGSLPETYSRAEVNSSASWHEVHSGNNVNLEREMMKAGEINRSYALNASVEKAFHKMLISTAKG